MELRYGTNPEQSARTVFIDESDPPFRLVSGSPTYINLLDALNAWQLVRETALALHRPIATSLKHVSPAGAATADDLDAVMGETWAVERGAMSPAATAYIRARDCDPKSSFGDFVAISEPVDLSLAHVLAAVVSDGIIAPGSSLASWMFSLGRRAARTSSSRRLATSSHRSGNVGSCSGYGSSNNAP